MTKKSPPVTVAERTWLTKKRPYKRQNKSNVPVWQWMTKLCLGLFGNIVIFSLDS